MLVTVTIRNKITKLKILLKLHVSSQVQEGWNLLFVSVDGQPQALLLAGGALAFLAIFATVICCIMYQRQKKRRKGETEDESAPETSVSFKNYWSHSVTYSTWLRQIRCLRYLLTSLHVCLSVRPKVLLLQQ